MKTLKWIKEYCNDHGCTDTCKFSEDGNCLFRWEVGCENNPSDWKIPEDEAE